MEFKTQMSYANTTAILITLDNLADGTCVVSEPINNSITRFIAADIQLTLVAGTVDDAGVVRVKILRSTDGGTTYDDCENADLLRIYNVNSSSATYTFSADTTRLGLLPDYWRLAVENLTGDALAATGNEANFVGKKFQIA